jgi:murein DD-endopeptidase MepM/ murein hydrolase activator NlpD
VARLSRLTVVGARAVPRDSGGGDVHPRPHSTPSRAGARGDYPGDAHLITIFVATGTLALLNPLLVREAVLQMVGNARIRKRLGAAARVGSLDHRNAAAYSLPFAGEWFVANGGVTPAESHSWDVLTQRYAYDFFVVDESLRRHRGAGTRVEDYYCYGRDILAAADGLVVRTASRVRTAPLVGYGVADFLARTILGNHVVIQHAEHEYAMYAHLVKGSVLVTPGQRVVRGQPIGQCGHSGNSSEPHLHFHVQDREDFFTAAGVPVRFTDVIANGNAVDDGYLRRGDRVRHRSATASQSKST